MSNVLISTVITEEWPIELEMRSTMINPNDLCESNLMAILFCPMWFPLGQLGFGLCCMRDTNMFCTEATINFHDGNKELKFAYWNWYFPCCKYKQTIAYSSIDDIAAYVNHNTTHNLDGTNTKRDMYFPVVITKDGMKRQLYQMGMLTWTTTAKRLENSNNNNTNANPVDIKNCGGNWSIQYVQGLHHFFFGRLTHDQKPVVQSEKYYKERSYQAPSTDTLVIKHTETEYTETVYSSA